MPKLCRSSALVPLALIVTMLDVAGCRSSRLAESGKGPDAAGNTKSTLLNSHDQDMRAKLKPIIRCLNGPMSWYENMRAYHDRVRALAGNNPPSTSPLMDTYFSMNDLEVADGTTSCANELDMGASLPPATPDLDAAARTAATAMRSLAGPGHQMDTYLKQSDYLQDHFARGKQLDAIISPLLTTTLTASKQVRAALERENGAIRQHELDAIDKREGHSLRWHTQRCMIAARALDDNLRRLNREGQLDTASAQAAVRPLKASIADAQAYVAAHPDEAKEVPIRIVRSGSLSMMDSLGNSAAVSN